MNEETHIDRIRALAEDRLTDAERERLLADLAADAELAALAGEFEAVRTLTAALEEEPPACGTTFGTLERKLAEAPPASAWRRRVAAAAAVVAFGVTGWLALRSEVAAEPVVLAAIDLEPQALPEVPPEQPAGLADYDPRGSVGVAWLDDFDTAAWLAEASGRPMLVFGGFRGCVMCKAMDEEVFNAGSVVDLAERFVPVRFDLAQLPVEEAEALMRRGYPFLEVWNPEREPLHPLSRRPDPEFFAESMRLGLAAAHAEGDVPSWDELRALARAFERGRASEDEGSLAGAEDSYSRLTAGSSKLYRQLGAVGLARISADARGALLRARDAAGANPEAAADELRRAVRRHEGTQYAADLRAVLKQLEASGRFPPLSS